MNKAMPGVIAVLLTLLLFMLVGGVAYLATLPKGGAKDRPVPPAVATDPARPTQPPLRMSDWEGKNITLAGCRVTTADSEHMFATWRGVDLACTFAGPKEWAGLGNGVRVTITGKCASAGPTIVLEDCRVTIDH